MPDEITPIPQLRATDLSNLPAVAHDEPGLFVVGYDQDNPAKVVRVAAAGFGSSAATTTTPGVVPGLGGTDPDNAAKVAQVIDKVTGPASATDNALVRFDGATGKLVQDSGIIIEDDGSLSMFGSDLRITPSGSNFAGEFNVAGSLIVSGSSTLDFGAVTTDGFGAMSVASLNAATGSSFQTTLDVYGTLFASSNLDVGGDIILNYGVIGNAFGSQYQPEVGITVGSNLGYVIAWVDPTTVSVYRGLVVDGLLTPTSGIAGATSSALFVINDVPYYPHVTAGVLTFTDTP